jgi:phenylpropionate dioxygenase-like ring-hydroxylating dioxygenase large terminal subunit
MDGPASVLNPVNLFDPGTYGAVRRPLLEASGLPPACYTDGEFFARESEAIFRRSWIMVGRGDEIARRGDYFTVDLGRLAWVVIRGADGEVRAFANNCRHRNARLLDGRGNCRTVVCPYHAWTYALDGSLRLCTGMESTIDFDAGRYGLVEMRVEQWGGFIWVAESERTEPFGPWLGELPGRLAMYGMDRMATARRAEFTVECNWKTWVENFMEGYHIPTVHRSTISKHRAINHAEDPPADGQFVTIFEQHDGTLALLDGDEGFAPIETLHGDSSRGSRFILVYPSTMIALTIDAMWCFQCNPLSVERTQVVLISCFPKDRLDNPDFARLAANYYKRQDIVVSEDNHISAVQQRGLRSVRASPGRFSPKEKIVHAFDNWVLDRVLGSADAAAAPDPRARSAGTSP